MCADEEVIQIEVKKGRLMLNQGTRTEQSDTNKDRKDISSLTDRGAKLLSPLEHRNAPIQITEAKYESVITKLE